jgi:hypothetical protein
MLFMETSYRPYAFNKLISLGVPLLFLAFVRIWYPFSSPTLWWIVIIFAHTLGYAHFALGFYYQASGLTRRRVWRRLTVLPILLVVAAAGSWFMIALGQLTYFSIFAVGYFILHGSLNEHTLMVRQLPKAPPAKYIVPLVFFIIPFFFLALPHPSFFFTPQFVFLNPAPGTALRYILGVMPPVVLATIVYASWGIFMLLVPVRMVIDRHLRSGVVVFVLALMTMQLGLQSAPINYAIIYFVLLSYHFISFSLFFYQEYQARQPQRIPAYVRDHFIVVTPFIALSLAAFYHVGQGASIHQTVFNGEIFLTLSMIHITTSLLNEQWFCKLCRL